MVTQNPEVASSEDASSPADSTTLPVTSGDEPLIPDNFVEGQGVVDPAAAATAPAETTGDETSPDDSAPETTPDSTEETPAAETTDALETTTSTEEAPAEGDEPAPRVRTDEEWNNRERTYRQRDAEKQTALDNLTTQVGQLQTSYNDQVLNAEVRGYEQAIAAQLVTEGHDEASAGRLASQQANATKAAFQAELGKREAEQKLAVSEQGRERDNILTSVQQQMQKWGVPENQRHLLQGYSDPALLIEAAEILGNSEKLRQESIKAKQAEVPSGGPANTFDGGTGAPSGGMSEAEWVDSVYNAPNTTAHSAADHARAKAWLDSFG